jgi:hypothetical protein
MQHAQLVCSFISFLHAERELMLIKLRAPAGPARTEVLQLAEIFRARVVDVSERGITLCVSGDPGKVRQAARVVVLLQMMLFLSSAVFQLVTLQIAKSRGCWLLHCNAGGHDNVFSLCDAGHCLMSEQFVMCVADLLLLLSLVRLLCCRLWRCRT